MNFESIANNIIRKDDGIYYSKSTSDISYPEDANEMYVQIEENSFWFKHRNAIIEAGVKKYCADKVFFDVGGGNGFVSKGVQNAGVDVVLVEPGPMGAKNAKNRGVENVICSTLEDADFDENSIDAIGVFDVVEHIENDQLFLEKLNHFLQPKGYLFITVPAFNTLWSNEDKNVGHFKRYTRKSMNELLTKTGFEVVQSSYLFSILPMPIFLFKSIPSKLGFGKQKAGLKKRKNEHKQQSGILGRILNGIWSWELKRVQNGKGIFVGSTYYVIARKV